VKRYFALIEDIFNYFVPLIWSPVFELRIILDLDVVFAGVCRCEKRLQIIFVGFLVTAVISFEEFGKPGESLLFD
jgi:hypothetical protein